MLRRLWNFEFSEFKKWHYSLIAGIVVLIGFAYVIAEVWFGANGDAGGFIITDIWAELSKPLTGPVSFEALFPYLFIALSVFTISVRVAVIVHSYIRSRQDLGQQSFARYFYTYFVTFIISTGVELLLILALSVIGIWLGLKLELGTNIISYGTESVSNWVEVNIPNLITIKSYWLSLGITILLSGLPLYFVHWLTHKSRFFWYVFHRPHHCPQYLHPLAAPPAFVFGFLLALPFGLVAIIISRFIYPEPMVMEIALWGVLGYSMEIFNHSSANYQFARQNFFVRNLSRLYGDRGVYHLMHHSAKPGDEMINLSSGPFQLWDRLFGTYRKPYEQTPEVGLTNKPTIKMNPLRIAFSGIVQLWYELKNNKNWRTRTRIIFGDIYYMPPVTRDFLIVGYDEKPNPHTYTH